MCLYGDRSKKFGTGTKSVPLATPQWMEIASSGKDTKINRNRSAEVNQQQPAIKPKQNRIIAWQTPVSFKIHCMYASKLTNVMSDLK